MKALGCVFLSVFPMCTHVFKEYLLSIYYVPGTVLGTWGFRKLSRM